MSARRPLSTPARACPKRAMRAGSDGPTTTGKIRAPGKRHLNKGQLDLYGVLLRVDRLVGRAIGIGLDERGRRRPVDFRKSQGRAESEAVVNRYFIEARRRVIRAEYYDQIEFLPLHLLECIGRDLAGKDKSGVGDYYGYRLPRLCAAGRREGISGLPLSGPWGNRDRTVRLRQAAGLHRLSRLQETARPGRPRSG